MDRGQIEIQENVVIVVDHVSCLLDIAQGTPCMRSKPLHQTVHSPPGIITLSSPPLAMLVANASFVFEDDGSIQQEEEEVENIWHWMVRCAVCYYACGETG